MNNQFIGPTAWTDYLTALERATPVIEAIAVIDYYVKDTYEEVLRHKAAGRLPATKLIFPNVELRRDVATARGGFVNLHLFVSPEDPKHVEELQRLLSRLQFNVMQDRFDCTRANLIRLGKKADPNITSRLATTLQDAIKTADIAVKQEIVAAATLARTLPRISMSINEFANRFNLSAAARESVSQQLRNPHLAEERFLFSASDFASIMAYRSMELDNGATLTAPSAEFDQVFRQVAIDGSAHRVRFTTQGTVINDKLKPKA
ncbi:hypothetical protein XI08_15290 [Bradyrhizobium sp. CCBAU 11361]|nr:hypothetical protein [Bradyrhizobium sp. CCBAU 11361]MDA9490425.1 hypothetical protein [Bradyrhizobium sp. CCBAU 11361]